MAQTQEQKIDMAKEAIRVIGGPVLASEKIQDLSGKACSRDRVQKWLVNGIPSPWHPIVHTLTGIPLTRLDADIYPSYLFSRT